jgi:hypothetical protein
MASALDWRQAVLAAFPQWGTPEWDAEWRARPAPVCVDDRIAGIVIAVAEFGVWLNAGIGVPVVVLVPDLLGAVTRPLAVADYPALGSRLLLRVRAVGVAGEVAAVQLADSASPSEDPRT